MTLSEFGYPRLAREMAETALGRLAHNGRDQLQILMTSDGEMCPERRSPWPTLANMISSDRPP